MDGVRSGAISPRRSHEDVAAVREVLGLFGALPHFEVAEEVAEEPPARVPRQRVVNVYLPPPPQAPQALPEAPQDVPEPPSGISRWLRFILLFACFIPAEEPGRPREPEAHPLPASYSERWQNFVDLNTVKLSALRNLFSELRHDVDDDFTFTRTATAHFDATHVVIKRIESITLENLGEMRGEAQLVFILRLTSTGHAILVPYRKSSLKNFFAGCHEVRDLEEARLACDPGVGRGPTTPLLQYAPPKSSYTVVDRTNNEHILLSRKLLLEIIRSRTVEAPEAEARALEAEVGALEAEVSTTS